MAASSQATKSVKEWDKLVFGDDELEEGKKPENGEKSPSAKKEPIKPKVAAARTDAPPSAAAKTDHLAILRNEKSAFFELEKAVVADDDSDAVHEVEWWKVLPEEDKKCSYIPCTCSVYIFMTIRDSLVCNGELFEGDN